MHKNISKTSAIGTNTKLKFSCRSSVRNCGEKQVIFNCYITSNLSGCSAATSCSDLLCNSSKSSLKFATAFSTLMCLLSKLCAAISSLPLSSPIMYSSCSLIQDSASAASWKYYKRIKEQFQSIPDCRNIAVLLLYCYARQK